MHNKMVEHLIQLRRLRLQASRFRLNAGFTQQRQPSPRYQRIRIQGGCYHPDDPRFNQPVGAGRCFAIVAARLQSHIGGGTGRFSTGHPQRVDFGMVTAPAQMGAHSENTAVLDNDAAHHRVYACLTGCASRQLQRQPHIPLIIY
ncbi:hypothetical protein D3C75_930610 [compost metagenome]